MSSLVLFFLFLLLRFTSSSVAAPPLITGDFHHLSGVTLTHPPDLLPGLQRLTLNIDNHFGDGRLFARTDIRNRFEASVDSIEWAFPELWLDLHFSKSDLRIGRQILQLGLSVANAPVDRIQPFDSRNFLIEPFSTLQRGTIALNYSYYIGNSRFRMIFAPVFTPSLVPDPESRWFPHLPVPAGLPVRIKSAPTKADKPQAALIWDTNPWRALEIQLGFLYWNPSMPAYRKSIRLNTPGSPIHDPHILLEETFTPTLIVTGGISWQITSSLNLLLETAWFENSTYDKIPDELFSFDPANPDLPGFPRIISMVSDDNEEFISRHPATDLLLEARYFGSDMQIGIQWYNQLIENPHPDVIQDTRFQSISAFTSRSFFRERLDCEVTATFQINGSDYWIRKELGYDILDGVLLNAGAHIFGGPTPKMNYGHPSFGSYRGNTLAYAGIRYYF